MSELLPCPFCGAQPNSGWCGSDDNHYWAIECPNCIGSLDVLVFIGSHGQDESDAIAAWNTRNPEPGQPAPMRSEYTEAICGDGAAILKDGVRMTISEVLAELNQPAAGQSEPVAKIQPLTSNELWKMYGECCERIQQRGYVEDRLDFSKLVNRLIKRTSLTSGPIPAAPAVLDEYQIIAIFKRAGFNIELGATYSAKGQIAQLIEGARKLLAASPEQQGGAG